MIFKKILAASISLVVFLIFWFVGLVLMLATGIPVLIGMILWTLLAGRVFKGVFEALV